jgi:hypothetical protein
MDAEIVCPSEQGYARVKHSLGVVVSEYRTS